jgi:hypothetical protein
VGHVLIRALALAALLAVACGGNSTPADMGMGGPDLFSYCGHPGDKGNSLGVGQYCTNIFGDCTGTASICSTAGSINSYFCTMTCTPPNDAGMPVTNCGENAYCQCGSGKMAGECGCYPNSCK